MRETIRKMLSALTLLTLSSGLVTAQEKPKNVEKLIDRLTTLADGDVGYSPSVSGVSFLPLDAAGEVHTVMLFQKPSRQSHVMRELVKLGMDAVPHLLKHLDDKRRTKIRITHDLGFGAMFFSDGCDINQRTEPLSVLPPEKKKKNPDDLFGETGHLHILTVGDLCFVALGQILNRDFSAVWYQPTAIIGVNSPTHSPRLAKEVRKRWGKLTVKKHKASLIADVMKPDGEYRRTGALKRLSYFYPKTLEELAPKVLAIPTYDIFVVEAFLREQLYRAKQPKDAKKLFDAFVKKHGEVYRIGAMLYLFEDLDTLEANEEGRLSPPLKRFSDQPRKLLIQLYGKKKSVKSTERPRFVNVMTRSTLARVIKGGLIYDESKKIDRMIQNLLNSIKDDDYLAEACMQRLVGRGYDADIKRYCERRLSEPDTDSLRKMMTRLGWTRLHVAIERRRLDLAGDLLKKGVKVDAQGANGDTALHVAMEEGAALAVKLLLDAKANVNRKNNKRLLPIQLAIQHDHYDIAKLLLKHGSKTPDVLSASFAGNVKRLKELLTKRKVIGKQRTDYKRSALHLASFQGHAEVAKLLLDHKADLEAKDEETWRPLHLAVVSGHVEVVKLLVDRKAKIDAGLEYEGDLRPIHLAAWVGKTEMIELLINAKANPLAAVGENKMTPLHMAAKAGKVDAIKLLLTKKAKVDVKTNVEATPLHLAAEQGHAEAVSFLIQQKAEVNAKTGSGETALILAVKKGDKPTAELLLKNGAKVNASSFFTGSPLHIATSRGHPHLIPLLKKYGAK